ncbi:hypothetical protein SERLA73DRAFT_58814 [Serpula lacrymans var. lacrymans S7.3]|uniref:DNA 3'-5' helicase n=1 Tax=Serpula lacrymans var. lacrymans (strain S7.3) TaxID=936435 RepID=F8Q5G4_SERL3|nr:hypothetical protein SERLA73DRAFT_58814 [Serpula lacrymans var. lacrymans S7.3]
MQAIRSMMYRAIIINPKQMMKAGGEFEKILQDPLFNSHLISVVFNKACCITKWGNFRPEYQELGCLWYILPSHIPFLVMLATLPPDTLKSVSRLLHLRSDKLITIHHSTDRPNIAIRVCKIQYPLHTYADLGFFIPDGWKPSNPPLIKFLIFFDNIQDVIGATIYLQSHLPSEVQNKIK